MVDTPTLVSQAEASCRSCEHPQYILLGLNEGCVVSILTKESRLRQAHNVGICVDLRLRTIQNHGPIPL
jgi:hypothetical protein